MMVTDTAEQYQMECDALGEKYFRVVKDAAKAADVPCEVVQVIHDHPYQAIIETANTRGCDLIFMASHGRRGMAALVLGSETTKVLTHTRIPVLVCRGRSPRTSHRSDEGGAPRRIFHPTDFPRRRGPRSIRRWPWLGAPGPSCSSST
jgi:hypothetical protein